MDYPNANDFKNIHVCKIASTDNETGKKIMPVLFNVSGKFEFDLRAIHLFFLGAQVIVESGKMLAQSAMRLYIKLHNFQLITPPRFLTGDADDSEIRGFKEDGGETSVELNRDEVNTLMEWIDARMQHCEKERDERATHPCGTAKFNSDTYITMKLLLIDLKQWLSLQAVDDLSLAETGESMKHARSKEEVKAEEDVKEVSDEQKSEDTFC
ncbi:MAG: hypothetical protein ACXAAH_01610 [Promethearchaeota archaeon]|jgi:hypothetical protein